MEQSGASEDPRPEGDATPPVPPAKPAPAPLPEEPDAGATARTRGDAEGSAERGGSEGDAGTPGGAGHPSPEQPSADPGSGPVPEATGAHDAEPEPAQHGDSRPEPAQAPGAEPGPPRPRDAEPESATAAGKERSGEQERAVPKAQEPPTEAPVTPSGRTLAQGHGPAPKGAGRPGGPQDHEKETRGGLLMGRPFGVPVYVSPSWFLVAALITWVFGNQLERILPDLGAARYLVSLFFAVALYASVLVHELAHTVAALRFRLPVRRIQLQFFGGYSDIGKESETPGREFVLAFVGPLLSLVLAGVFYLSLFAVEPGTVPGVLLAGLMISNLIVAAFNLLPGLPLDGGRMLRAVVWKITGRPMAGTVAAAWAGRALAVAVLIGFPLLTRSGAVGQAETDGMDTVLDALLAAIVAAIMWTGAGNSLRMARLRERLPQLRARTLTRRAVPVQPDTPVSEALRRANEAGARALVVVDAVGEPLSLVRETGIAGVPEHRRPWVAVSTLATDLTEGMRVSAELGGEELLETLRAAPATEYLVVEESGAIYGVLSAADVENAFVKAMARRG